jgi:hypothetical protein
MARTAFIGLLGSLLCAGALMAQPVLKVKANTIVDGNQSSTITVASGQIVSFTNPIPSYYAYVNYIIENLGNQTLTISASYNCENNIWSCEGPPATIAPNHTAQITMTFGGTGQIPGANPLGSVNLTTNAGSFVLEFQGIEGADPTMTIVSGDGINITAQSQPYTYLYPTTTVGVPVSRVFTFTDTANNSVALNVYNYVLTPVIGSCFSLISGTLPDTIYYGSPDAVRYRMQSGSAGTCESTISFYTNASAFPTFSWTLKGTVN